MAAWKGGFDRNFDADQFEAYVAGLQWTGWRPQFVTVHNTGSPSLAQWRATPGGEGQRIKNLEHYYRDQQHWSSGPHLFIGDRIWLGTPLTVPGTHSPSWNGIAVGMEIAGDYDHDQFDGVIRDNAIAALAALHTALGINPDTIRLHKEDKRTTHDCPGKNIVKADLIAAVKRAMLRDGEHTTVEEETSAAVPVKPATHVVKAGDTLWGISRRYGVPVADLLAGNGGTTAVTAGQVLSLTGKPLAAPAQPSKETDPGQIKMAQSMSSKGLRFIAREEVGVLYVYMDGDTPASGFGHNDKAMKVGDRITEEKMIADFRADVAKVEKALNAALKVPVAQGQYDGLGAWAYNLGVGVIPGASLIAKLNAGDAVGAGAGLLAWNKRKVKQADGSMKLEVSPGLDGRRKREKAIFDHGDYGDISMIPIWRGTSHKDKTVERVPLSEL